MKKLIESTAAFATFSNDVRRQKLSHAYLVLFDDTKNMREVLKLFALAFFGFQDEINKNRLTGENLPDMKIFPEVGKKFNVAAASELVSDSALKPVERDKKLYIVCGIDEATPLVQNKLLKTLEEPPEYACFLLGAAATAPVLDTVLSRVKTLKIPPFSEEQIFEALERRGHNPLNARVAASCAGNFGVAESMIEGGVFEEISSAALEICTANIEDIGELSIKYGNVSYKKELLAQMEYLYAEALRQKVFAKTQGKVANRFSEHTLIYALESLNKANADLKYNAFFQGLLYDFMLRVFEENERWSKLQA